MKRKQTDTDNDLHKPTYTTNTYQHTPTQPTTNTPKGPKQLKPLPG